MDDAIAQEADDIEDLGVPDFDDIETTQNMRNRIRRLWRRARNWYTITELNRRYLEGRLGSCASYGGFVDPETDAILGLPDLHDYGLISTNSCPGWENFRILPPVRQRAYLFFSIPTLNLNTTSRDSLRNFIQALVDSRDVYTHVRYQYYNAPNTAQRDRSIIDMMPQGSCHSLPIFDPNVWVTEGWGTDLDGQGHICAFSFVQDQRFDGYTGDWSYEDTGDLRISTCGSSFRDDHRPFPASHAVDPLQISVVARDWGYTGTDIVNLIRALLDQSGILRGYGR